MPAFRPFSLILAAAGLAGIAFARPAVAAPVITNFTLTPTALPVTGGTVVVSATVTDSVPITSVTALVANNGSKDSNVQITLSNGGTGSVYKGAIAVTHPNVSAAPYAFLVTVTAKDAAASQTLTSTTPIVQANDNLPPAISSITFTPATLPVAGGLITVKAVVADPGKRAITEVRTQIYRNGSTFGTSIPLTNGGSGSTYSGTFNSYVNNTSNVPFTYSSVVTATNDLGLSSSTSGGSTVQANASIPPVIGRATINPSSLPATGGITTISAVVSDPNGRQITKVMASISAGTNYNIELTNGGSGNIYTAISQWGARTGGWVLTGTVTAVDDLGLSNTVALNTTQGFAAGTLPELIAPNASSLAVSPASIAKGSPNLNLALNGINFQAGSTVLFNGKALVPTSISPTAIIVVVPAALLTTAGAYEVSVVNPAPGGVSNGIAFNVF